jgi:hypothetical protein
LQEALERFTWAFVGAEPSNFHAAVAMLGALVELDSGGWRPAFYLEFSVSFLMPRNWTGVVERDATSIHLRDAQEAIDFFVSRGGPDAVGRLHSEAMSSHTGPDEP